MKFRYLPDDAAVPGFPWNITALSQRDVQITIPIPFVTAPGVALTAACFGHGTYDDYAAEKCISNLLALGFRRLYVDLYWDAPRRMWSFCPVQIPRSSNRQPAHGPSTSARPASHNRASGPGPSAPQAAKRQQDKVESKTIGLQTPSGPSTSVSRVTLPVSVSTRSDTTVAVIPTTSPSKGVDETLYSIGPYTCSQTSGVDILNNVLLSFLDITDNTLAAVLRYVVLNLHAAASPLAPTAPAPEPEPSAMPQASDHLSGFFNTKFTQYLFTPHILRMERRNLADSWFQARAGYRPQPDYYTRIREQGVVRTPDGWPSESVLEFQQDYHHRILVAFGSIDPQMRRYNISKDEAVMFPPSIIDSPHSENCIFNYDQPHLSTTNNSWSTSPLPIQLTSQIAQGTQPHRLQSVTHLVECGISPILNETLSAGTAGTDVKPYRDVAFSSFWSWAPNEPKVKPSSDSFRCAVLNPSTSGRWHVKDCSDTYHAACRVHGQPFKWVVSASTDEYSEARGLCPVNSTFSVPQTALENRYLFETYKITRRNGVQPRSLPPIWIDLNSMDAATCWVSGINSTCPYEVSNSSAQIYVPTIAGVVILVVAALLLLVKCGANRRNSRRRRRGSGGWDYEGVPS